MAYKIIPVKLGSIIPNIKNMTRGFGKPSSIGEQFMGFPKSSWKHWNIGEAPISCVPQVEQTNSSTQHTSFLVSLGWNMYRGYPHVSSMSINIYN